MRRLGLLTVMSLFIVGLFAAVAYAAFVTCPGGERCRGTDEADTIVGSPDPERILASDGNDFVLPSAGRERLFAANDNDDIYGGRSKDRMFGGLGNDYIVGDRSEDQLNGGDGNDVIVSGTDFVADEVTCGPGEDVAYLSQADHNSTSQDCERTDTFNAGFAEVANENPDIVGGTAPGIDAEDAGDPRDPDGAGPLEAGDCLAPESGDPGDIPDGCFLVGNQPNP